MIEFHAIFIISCIAVLAPLLNRIPVFARAPIVAIELLLGMLVGPSGAGLVNADSALDFLREFGLVYLFFQAGFEFNQKEISGKPLRLGFYAWLVSLSLSLVISGALYLLGLVEAPLLVALILPTSAFGILILMLRQAGELDDEFGHYVLGVAAVSELGPLVLASIVLAQHNHHLHQTLLSASFIAIGLAAIFLLKRVRSDRLAESIVLWLGDGELLPIRISIVVLLGFVSFADRLGMELVVGSYMAGMAVAVLVRGTRAEILKERLTAIGSGFLIPLFFIESGAAFDFPALVSSPASVVRFILFCVAFLLIRLAPLNLFRGTLPERDMPALALLSSTTLPLVVALTYLGVGRGQMSHETASALVGAAMVTVTAFPTLAFWLRGTHRQSRLADSVSLVAHAVADWCSLQASAGLARLPPQWREDLHGLERRVRDLINRSAK
ncbi:cation:proton antiporter [Methylocystis sp.]|uniref:cation:proton antiporter n=1 Tax=Methylocystis sp. TaxID=1911079 RepID=UPI0025E4E1B9|nr:cation:proton antiporter [Methylocystis sp.]